MEIKKLLYLQTFVRYFIFAMQSNLIGFYATSKNIIAELQKTIYYLSNGDFKINFVFFFKISPKRTMEMNVRVRGSMKMATEHEKLLSWKIL